MTTLQPVKIGWIGKTINILVAAINARTIIVPTGGGIDIQETTSGTLLSLTRVSATAPVDLTALTARVAALEAILKGSAWTGVDVMDTSCVRSTINVLTKP